MFIWSQWSVAPEPQPDEEPQEDKRAPTEISTLSEFASPRGRTVVKVKDKTVRLIDQFFPSRHFGQQVQQNEVLGPVFSNVIIFVIVCNCLEIGATCQWQPDPPGEIIWTDGGTLEKAYVISEIVFTSFYFAEAFMKMWRLRLKYFTQGLAHPLELLIAMCGAMQVALALSREPGKYVPPVVKTFVKVMSLLRLLRIFRALSFLTSIPELAITIGGLMGSFRTLWWVLLVLVLFVFAFSVYFVIQVNDEGSIYWGDLLTAMQTLASVLVVKDWTNVLEEMDDNPNKYGESSPKWLLLLHLPFYAFALLTVFGVTNIIVGVIVDATSLTKRELNWARTRATLVRVGTAWESLSKSEGLDALDNTSEDPNPELQVTHQETRQAILQAVLEGILTSGEMGDIFPPGTTSDEFRMLLDYEGDGVITHQEFCINLGRLLLCDEVQLRILSLVQQGQTRRQVRKSLDQLSELKDRVNKFEGEMAKCMDAGFSEIMDLIDKSASCPMCSFNK